MKKYQKSNQNHAFCDEIKSVKFFKGIKYAQKLMLQYVQSVLYKKTE